MADCVSEPDRVSYVITLSSVVHILSLTIQRSEDMSTRYVISVYYAVSTDRFPRFIKLYNSLPAEAQQTLVEKHLAGLLDNVSKDKSKKGEKKIKQIGVF